MFFIMIASPFGVVASATNQSPLLYAEIGGWSLRVLHGTAKAQWAKLRPNATKRGIGGAKFWCGRLRRYGAVA
jgi:hypothetical protein